MLAILLLDEQRELAWPFYVGVAIILAVVLFHAKIMERKPARRPTCPPAAAMLFLMHLADRQPRVLRDHLDEHVAGSRGQMQRMESFPDLDALAGILDGRRLRFELAVALRCPLFCAAQYFVTVIGGAAGRRGHEFIRLIAGESSLQWLLNGEANGALYKSRPAPACFLCRPR